MVKTMLGISMVMGLGWDGTPSAWHTDYSKAHAEACSTDKPLFIVLCSESSEYGRMAALGTFLSDAIERHLQADYVRVMINTDSASGQELARQFECTGDIHFAILDRSGRWQVYYKTGYLLEDDLRPVLAQFRRTKLAANGQPVREPTRRPTIQLCST